MEMLQLETLISEFGELSKTNRTLPDKKEKTFTLSIAAPSYTASNTEEAKFQIDSSTLGKMILLFWVSQGISN